MANKKINELQSRVPSLTDLLLVGDPSSGYSYKCTVTELATIIETDISDNFVTLTTTQSISGAKTFSNILTLTSVANATTDTDKFLVLNTTNVVNYRTGSEVLSDIGGQGALTLTTTGTSGAATLVGNTLNIPQYQTALTNPVTGTGTTNYLAKFTGTSTIGNSIVFDNGTNVGIGGSSPAYKLDVTGDIRSTTGAYFATSSGNIGIGTASPTGSGGPILHIKAGSIPEIHLTNSTTGDAYNDGFSLNVNGLNTYFNNYENGFLSFYTNNTERVRIAADGNVTFTQIANATTDTDRFLVSDSGVIKYRTGSELLSDIGGQAALTNPVTGTGTTNYIPKFTGTSAIGNSGVVDNGTSMTFAANTYALGASNTTEKYLQFKYSSGDFYVGGTSSYAYLYTASSTPLAFFINNAEQMRLTSTGLGIGTSSPGYSLDIYKSGGNLRIYNTANPSALATYSKDLGAIITSYYSASGSPFTRTMDIVSNADAGAESQIRFLTATTASNPTERMRLDASGNLGLGVTPSAWGNIFTALQIKNTSLSAVNGIVSVLGGNSYYNGTSYTYIQNGYANQLEVNNSGSFLFQIAPSGTAGNAISFTQAMTLDASGRLGIGVTSMSGKLDVKGSAGVGIRLIHSNNNEIAVIQEFSGTQGAGLVLKKSDATQTILLNAGGDSYINGGNVGIGTTSPNSLLTIKNPSASGEQVIWNIQSAASTTSIGRLTFNQTNDEMYLVNQANGAMLFGTNSSERMRITSGGLVGIGTSSPSTTLQVTNTSGELFRLTNTTGSERLHFYTRNAATTSRIGSQNSSLELFGEDVGFNLVFGTSNTERMRIKSGGVINLSNVPSSATGLATGDIYRDGDGYLLIVL